MRPTFDDLDEPPSLRLGHRAALDDRNRVAEPRHVVLVMHLEAGAASHRLLVQPMEATPFHLDDTSLVHFIADDLADPNFASLIAHWMVRASSLSLIIVLIRAIRLRAFRIA